LLVLGGSGGAHALNESVPRALYKLRDRLDEWQIVHQCGPRDVAFTKELYRKLMIEAIVVPFVENLPAVLRRTDLAVGRAGGTTLAELAATGVPAVLVPYPHATDDHQRRNADVFVAAGAARMIEERMLEGRLDDAIHDALDDLLDDQALRQSLSTSMFHLARPEAAWQVATMVRELADRIMERKAA
jgi:UDP-N-acetylglucosamine--N-acetylmuramyl-(pentapeptide) pyrophosphoryl-undecaprenol N-acetylglucosamine transferase